MQNIFFKLQCSAIGLLLCSTLGAQNKHEFSLYGGGGLSTLQYKVNLGEHSNGFGGHFGVGYHYFFSTQWGLGTGVELAFYNARFTLNNFDTRYMTRDVEGSAFEFRSKLSGYKEGQRTTMLQIPLMLQFQTPLGKQQLYAAVGGKVGIPLSGKYKIKEASVVNSGYYEYENYEYTTQEFMGFGTFSGKNVGSDLDFKPAFFAALDLGVKWKLKKEGWWLYTGAYMDYGLNSIAKAKDLHPLVEYNAANPRSFRLNGVINSYAQSSVQSFTDKVNPIAAGIKLRLVFGKSNSGARSAADYMAQFLAKEEEARKRTTEDRLKKTLDTQHYTDEVRESKAWKSEEALAQATKALREAEEERDRAEELVRQRTREVQERIVEVQDMRLLLQPVSNYTLSETKLSYSQRQQWSQRVEILQRYPDIKVAINGHTGNLGSNEVNQRVGQQRADEVKAYLLSKGIAADRILGTVSKAATEPAVPNNSEKNRRINRRVALEIQ